MSQPSPMFVQVVKAYFKNAASCSGYGSQHGILKDTYIPDPLTELPPPLKATILIATVDYVHCILIIDDFLVVVLIVNCIHSL